MLTADDKEEIKRLVGEVVARLQLSSPAEGKDAQPLEHVDALQNVVARIRDLAFNDGFTELTFINPFDCPGSNINQ